MYPLRQKLHTEIRSQSPSQGTRQTRHRAHVHLWYVWRNISTTARPTTLIFAPRIQLHSPPANDPPLRKNTDAPAAKKSRRSDQASVASEPSATPQTSTATAGSSWEADPVLIPSNLISSSDEDIAQVYRQHWPQIRTRFSRHNRIQDWYNFRLSTISPTALREQLSRIFADVRQIEQSHLKFCI